MLDCGSVVLCTRPGVYTPSAGSYLHWCVLLLLQACVFNGVILIAHVYVIVSVCVCVDLHMYLITRYEFMALCVVCTCVMNKWL